MIIWEKVSGGENGEGRSKKGGNNSNNNNNTNERYYYLASSSFPHLSQCSKLQNVFIITCSLFTAKIIVLPSSVSQGRM